jgi:hypothetical protein
MHICFYGGFMSPEHHQKAVDYIKQHARPLEKALYAHYFEHGTVDAILIALASFQNADGGFGHGLEADIRLADSSVIATTIAFQKFRELAVSASHPMVQKAANYLLSQYDSVNKIWCNIPATIDDAPHAPWWEYTADPQHYLVNSRAEIIGYCYDYPNLFPADLRDTLIQALLTHTETHTDVEMHDLLCYIRLAETANLPSDIKEKLVAFLTPHVEKMVSRLPSQWGGYGLTPLTVVSTPQSLFYPHFADIIPQNLAFIDAQQTEAGYWLPSWSWEFASADGWREAERDLCGVITLGNLLYHHHFKG